MLRTTHPVTAVSVTATTLMFALYTLIDFTVDHNRTKGFETALEIFVHLSLAVLFFAFFALCLESIRPKWSTIVKTVIFAVFGILSITMSFIVSDYIERSRGRLAGALLKCRNSLGFATVGLYIVGLIALSFILALYFSYSHDVHERFNDHMMNAGSGIFFNSIIYGVIQLGVLFLTIIITLLLYDDAFEYLPAVLILINGLFFVPSVICALTRQNDKANMFMQVLVRYVMLTIVALAYLIIYIYILKLVITRSVPSNSVYAILTALFVVSMLIAYLSTVYEEKGILQKFAYNAPVIFAPFVLMQCYTIIVRIGQYGLTPMRYFGIAFILFEIVYIAYYTVIKHREHEIAGRNVLLIMCAFIVVTIFLPGISARSLSTSLAKHALQDYLEKSSAGSPISDREYVRANAAYGFLRENDFGEGRLEKYFGGIDADTLHGLKEGAIKASKALSSGDRSGSLEDDIPIKTGWFNAEPVEMSKSGIIDISGFDQMMYVNVGDVKSGYAKEDAKPVDTSKLSVYAYNEKNEINESTESLATADLSDYCRKFNELTADCDDHIITYDDRQKQLVAMSVIDINENARLYITNADISRNAAGETVGVAVYGYLFVRNEQQ